MAVKIRLRREGRKKTPMYRIVIADSKAPRDGRFIEIIGQYQPQLGENAINLKHDRVEYWMNVGALPCGIEVTDQVGLLQSAIVPFFAPFNLQLVIVWNQTASPVAGPRARRRKGRLAMNGHKPRRLPTG